MKSAELAADPAGPLVAQVFKTRIDPFVQKLSFIRVYSGTLKKDASVNVVGARKPMKAGQLLQVQAEETGPVDEAGPGMIVAIAKMEELETGSTLGDTALPPIPFPRRWSGWPSAPRAAATRASYPAR